MPCTYICSYAALFELWSSVDHLMSMLFQQQKIEISVIVKNVPYVVSGYRCYRHRYGKFEGRDYVNVGDRMWVISEKQ